jgi:5'-3' exonuclease
MSRLFCIDASIYIFRAYFSMPDRWFNEDGCSLNVVVGYTRFLVNFIREACPHYLMAAFDESLGSGFRHSLYADYKSNRALPDEALAFQLMACRRITELMGIKSYACANYEADDYIASAARLARRDQLALTVVSRDKDLVQVMIAEHDEWCDYAGAKRLRKAQWEGAQQMQVGQMADYLALMGDSADAIPGVPGIGKLGASRLLAAYGDIDGIYRNLEALPESGIRSAKRIQQALMEHREQLLLARQLTGLYDRVIPDTNSELFSYGRFTKGQSTQGLADYLQEIGCGLHWTQTIVKDFEAIAL